MEGDNAPLPFHNDGSCSASSSSCKKGDGLVKLLPSSTEISSAPISKESFYSKKASRAANNVIGDRTQRSGPILGEGTSTSDAKGEREVELASCSNHTNSPTNQRVDSPTHQGDGMVPSPEFFLDAESTSPSGFYSKKPSRAADNINGDRTQRSGPILGEGTSTSDAKGKREVELASCSNHTNSPTNQIVDSPTHQGEHGMVPSPEFFLDVESTSQRSGSGHTSPQCQARRRLFDPDEVDSWPIVIQGDDGSEVIVSADTPAPAPAPAVRKRKSNASEIPASRKRSRNPSRWLVNVRKEAKNAGRSYITAKGVEVPAKVLRSRCTACKFECSKISEADRQQLLNTYNNEKTTKGKWEMLARLMEASQPQSKAEDTVSGKNRQSARKFFFVINKQKLRVCRFLFMNTFCISERVISTVFKKLDGSFKISPDKRGGHTQRPHRIPETVRESVITHINSFPRVASHFCRAETSFEYLEPEVQSQANMYRLYKEWCTDNNIFTPATEGQYRHIFNHTPGLKIAFFHPKKDICNVCYSHAQLTPEEKEKKKLDYEEHRKAKEIPQNMKREDRKAAESKTNTTFCAAVFDLQKVLFTPKCNAGDLYYKRKYSNYNFTVWDLGKHECFCYCWHESIAHRGSNEIASFLMDFLSARSAQGFKKFHLYADNCSGQNKNRMIYSMLMHVAAKYNVEIVLRFLCTGHTQNEGDSAHATIESKSKNIDMFEPEDWWKLIETAKQPDSPRSLKKPFVVKRVVQEDIFDFHNFVKNLSVWDRTADGQKPTWNTLQEISFDGKNPWTLDYKCDLASDVNIRVDTKPRIRGHPVNLATYKFPNAYDGQLPISKAKLKDLLSFCDGPNPTVPQEKQAFYRALKESQQIRDDEFYMG